MAEETKVTPEATAEAEAPAPEKPKKKKVDKKFEELQAKHDELTDQHQRMLAEYANYKRRTEQEKMQVGEFTTAELLKKLLPVVDNFDRAAEAEAGPAYKDGVLMIVKQLNETLQKIGLSEIEAEGKPFDPEIHYAVQRVDATDGVESDTVVSVLQKGYTLGDRLVRPAMVVVAE
ncbi:MAG: nucleotide exchange factor GrpE [Clostridia bacterium]|nr:nucleotide exchange factor GrpE [Clostridia bacterium]